MAELPLKQQQKIEDKKIRLQKAIKTLNEKIKALAKLGIQTELQIIPHDETKKEQKLFPGEKKLVGFPKTIPGVKYKKVLLRGFKNKKTGH